MNRSLLGPLMVGLIVVGIGGFLLLNAETSRPTPNRPAASPSIGQQSGSPVLSGGKAPVGTSSEPGNGLAVREFPIGDEVEKNHIRVAAVWLPSVMMDGTAADPSLHLVHLEADVRSSEGNPNGYAKDEKVCYLEIDYKLIPAAGGTPLAQGKLSPMMARDGFHYGATIAMPAPGEYQLVYAVRPPTVNGLSMGRHSDPASGVAPWWAPFEVKFDWTVDAPTEMPVSLR